MVPEKPIWVPVAFPEEEALHVLGAIRAVIHSGLLVGDSDRARPLASAMLRLAEATDEARRA